MIEEVIFEGRRLVYENCFEGKDLDEFDEFEDEEEEVFLEEYWKKCMVEMN